MNKERGFSLIELMISLVIGLIILLGLVVVYVSAVRAHNTNNALAQVQENGRFALGFLAGSIREAGGTGCSGKENIAVALNRNDDGELPWWADYDHNAIRGVDNDSDDHREDNTPSPFASTPTGTGTGERIVNADEELDAIAVVGAGNDNLNVDDGLITGNLQADHPFPVTDAGDIGVGSILVACDGSQSSVFQVTGVSNDGHDIEHEATGNASPGNCTEQLGYPINVTSPTECASENAEFSFSDEMTLSVLEPAIFYIGNTDHGTGRALFRRQMVVTTDGSVEWQDQELVPDVEGMMIRYGYGSNDGIDHYADAATINTNDSWDRVRAVRIYLLISSAVGNALSSPTNNNQNNQVQDQTLLAPFSYVDTSDSRLRRVFVTTIAIRNRLK